MNKTTKLVYTAIMLALLVSVQFVTKASGQLVTGSSVNFILMFTALILGSFSASVVALVSPFMAFILGIGTPIIQIVPMIALGNLSYVLCGNILANKLKGKYETLISVVVSSFVKFVVLFVGVTKLVLPSLGLPDAKVAALSLAFSWTQLFTALIGGVLASQVAPRIKKAVKMKS